MGECGGLHQRIKELLITGLEGLQHVEQQMCAGNYTETASLLESVLLAITTIDQSLKKIPHLKVLDRLEFLYQILQRAFSLLIQLYEQQLWLDAQRIIQEVLLPGYKNWMTEILTNLPDDQLPQRRCQLLLRQ